MSKHVAFATISIETAGAVEDFIELNDLDSPDTEQSVTEAISNKLSEVEFTAYNATILRTRRKRKQVSETIFVKDGKASLSKYTFAVNNIEFILNPYNYSSTAILSKGKELIFPGASTGTFALIAVDYQYDCIELTTQYSSSGSGASYVTRGVKYTSERMGVLEAALLELKETTELRFEYAKPDLYAEVITDDTGSSTLRAGSVSFDNMEVLTLNVFGGSAPSLYRITEEEITETVEFTNGYGHTAKNIVSLTNVELLQNNGIITVDPETYNDNRLKFTAKAVEYGGTGSDVSALANITYNTKYLEWDLTITAEECTYRITDLVGNVVTGTVNVAAGVGGEEVCIKVKDYFTSLPISGATVTLKDLNLTGLTDSAGLVTFKNVPTGSHPIGVTASGYIGNVDDNLINDYIEV